jgi:hypothetical protein
MSLRGIAKAMRLSRNAVVERASRLGVHVPMRAGCRRAAITSKPQHGYESVDSLNRDPLPAGHPISWALITDGTSLEGVAYEIPRLSPVTRTMQTGFVS